MKHHNAITPYYWTLKVYNIGFAEIGQYKSYRGEIFTIKERRERKVIV